MPINFKINVKGLLAGIQPAAVVASTAAKKECLSANHVALEATPDSLFVNANNGRVSVRNPIPYEGAFCTDYFYKEGGTVTVRAADLISVLESFSPAEVLTVEVGEYQKPELPADAKEEERKAWEMITGTEVRLRPERDPEQMQTLPILSIPVTVQSLDGQAEQSLTVPRTTFCRALGRVLFAGGFEERREKTMYWKLHGTKHAARFTAGTGARFAIEDLRGEKVTDVSDGLDLLIPVEQSPALLKVFGDSTHPTVTIKHFGNRIGFESDTLRMVCVGLNPHIQWWDENLILKRTNLYKFTVAVADLELAVKGIIATNSEEAKKRESVHAVTLSFDVEKKLVQMFSDRYTKKALRKVKLSDTWTSGDQPNEVKFKCNALYINEVVKTAEKSTHVQFELIGNAMPMIVRFHGGEHVVQEQPFVMNAGVNAEEAYTMLVARIAE